MLGQTEPRTARGRGAPVFPSAGAETETGEAKYWLTQGSGWSQGSAQPVGTQRPQPTKALCFRPAPQTRLQSGSAREATPCPLAWDIPKSSVT